MCCHLVFDGGITPNKQEAEQKVINYIKKNLQHRDENGGIVYCIFNSITSRQPGEGAATSYIKKKNPPLAKPQP